MVDDDNITLTSLIIICNYIRYAFGNCAILPEEAVHILLTRYIVIINHGKNDYGLMEVLEGNSH